MKPLDQYETPETDAVNCGEWESLEIRYDQMRDLAEKLERRLAACREALEQLLPLPWARTYPDGPCLEKSNYDMIRETLTLTEKP